MIFNNVPSLGEIHLVEVKRKNNNERPRWARKKGKIRE